MLSIMQSPQENRDSIHTHALSYCCACALIASIVMTAPIAAGSYQTAAASPSVSYSLSVSPAASRPAAKPKPATPATPTGLRTLWPSASALAVEWSPVSGAVKYQMQWSTSSAFKKASTWTTTSAIRAVTGLKPGTTYYTRVRASSTAKTGSWSKTLTATTARAATGRAATAVPVSGGTKAQTAAIRSYLAAWGKYSYVTSVTFAPRTAHLGYTTMDFNNGHATILLRSSLSGTQLRQVFAHELSHATQAWVYKVSPEQTTLASLGAKFGHTSSSLGALDMAADCMAQSNTASKADLYYQTRGCSTTELSWAKLLDQGWKV